MLSSPEFEKLLRASCLDLPEDQKESFLVKLQNIIQFLDRIQSATVSKTTQPLITPLENQYSHAQTDGAPEEFNFFGNIKHQVVQDHVVIKSPVTSKD